MKLIFVRHAIAEGHHLDNPNEDALRELTAEGIKRFEKDLKNIASALPSPDVIFCSPLLRSIQTAELVYERFPSADLELITDLDLLGNPRNLVEYISFLPVQGNYIFVGHEPHFSSVIAALLGLHPEHDFLKFKKGAFLALEGSFWEGFMLTWFAPPALIRSLG